MPQRAALWKVVDGQEESMMQVQWLLLLYSPLLSLVSTPHICVGTVALGQNGTLEWCHWRRDNQKIGSSFRVGMPCAFYWPKQLLELLFIDLDNRKIGGSFRVGMPCAFYWPEQLLELLFIDLGPAQDDIHVKGRLYWQILLYFEYGAFHQWLWGYYFKRKMCVYVPRTSPASAELS